MTSAVTPIESLIPLVRDAHTVDRSGVAATACLVYDIVITWDQEVDYIWKSAWTPPKFLYLFSRYFSLIVQIVNTAESTNFGVTNKYCHDWTIFEGVAGQLIVMGVEISLMLRVYALYKRDKRVLALLVSLYFAEVTTLCVVLGLALRGIVSVAPLRGILPSDFPLSGCFPTYVPSYFYSYWIPPLIFESVLFLLMTINFARHIRAGRTPMPLLTQFFRDGTVYYAVIFVTLLTNVLLYELVNSALAQVAIGWELTVFSIAGARLILNLRASGSATRSPAGTAEAATIEMIRFGANSSTDPFGHLHSQDVSMRTNAGIVCSWGAERSLRVHRHGGSTPGSLREEDGMQGRAADVLNKENAVGLDTRRDWIFEWENA